MPYYGAGDYYRGDYYRGDLWGIGKFLKKAAGTVTGVVSKLGIPGVSGAAGVVHGLIAGGKIVAPQLPAFNEFNDIPYNEPDNGGGTIPGMTMTRPGRRPGDTGRIGHFKKDGTWTNRARPRLNAGNMKALRRANRRAHAFLRAARTAVRYFTPKAPKGKAYVSFKKKRA